MLFNYAEKPGMQEDFLISVNGGSECSTIEVLKLDSGNNVVQCAHSLTSPPFGLKNAVGGVLQYEEGGGQQMAIVICGGEMSAVGTEILQCTVLNTDSNIPVTQLDQVSNGGAAVVVDNGRTLWVTGGRESYSNNPTTEFIGLSHSRWHGSYFLTNEQGPVLPLNINPRIANHCFVSVGTEVAILVGGQYAYTNDFGQEAESGSPLCQ